MDAYRRRVLSGFSIANNATGNVYVPAPGAGKWRLKAIGILANVTSAADGTNYITATVTNVAGTTMGSYTTASTAITAGTYRGFTLTASVNPEVDGDGAAEVITMAVTKAGTGVPVAGYLVTDWESVQAA